MLRQSDTSNALGQRHALLALFVLSTGLKPEELTQLNLEDVQTPVLMVPSHIAFNGRPRRIPLDNLARGCVRKLLECSRSHLLASADSSPLFQALDGERITAAEVKCVLDRMGQYALLAGSISSRLRRSFARRLLARGFDLFEVADQLGVKTLGAVVQNTPVKEWEAVQLLLDCCHPHTWPRLKLQKLLAYHFRHWSPEKCRRVAESHGRRAAS